MRKACLAIVFLALALIGGSAVAKAQCSSATIPGCKPAVSPQPGDLLLLYQIGQNPHPRGITIQQLSNTTAGTFTNLSVTGNGTIAGTLGVTGATTLSSLSATSATLSGTLAVTGNETVGGSLSAGATNVTSITAGAASLSSLTTTGNTTIGGTLNVTGLTTLSAPLRLSPYLIANLPSVPAPGELAWATDCRRNTQGAGLGTGCVYFSDTTGTWQRGDISNLTITIGSATPIILGGSIPGSGTGANVQMTTAASKVNGNCVQFDATGNTVDAGIICGGGGGGGVAAAPQYSLGYYASPGSVASVAGLTPVANTVPVYSGSGILSLSATLPGGMVIPSPTISNPTISGTANVSTISMAGKITTAASTVAGANFNLLPGTTPGVPINGDIWLSAAGFQGRNASGATKGPFIGLTDLSATGVLGYNNATGVISCATCATTTSGGALSATTPLVISVAGLFTCPTCATTTNGGILSAAAPMTINAAGVIALGQTQQAATLNWDAGVNVTNNTYALAIAAPFVGGGTIKSITARTGGTGTPSFTAAVKVAGTTLSGCTVTPTGVGGTVTASCTGTSTFASGNEIDVVISGVAGTPNTAAVQVNYTSAAL